MRDQDIRKKLKETYLKKYYADTNTKVVEEMNVCYGDARVDMAVVNGVLHGYEIKSECDTLLRLSGQLATYSKVFDYVTIVTGESHLDGILATAPAWCGIVVVDYKKTAAGIKLKTYRPAKKNNAIDKVSLAQLLWKEEAISALNTLGITKGLTGKNKRALWQLLAANVTIKQLSVIVRHQLKTRANWKAGPVPCENDDCLEPCAM